MRQVLDAIVIGSVAVVIGASFAIAQGAATGPAVKPAAVAKKAGTAPPASAKPAKAAGNNKVTISTANSATDDDSFWIERIDSDGDGDIEDANLVWDDEDKVLFAYIAGAFTCKNGGTATAELLVATYADGNVRKKPAGSGFWVADLDKGECGAQAAGLWGCKFDASGSETACGIALLDATTDDLVIATVAK